MNADRLLALYDRVAEAPDAVKRLRRFVLDLAVRGRLVEQDVADEPATNNLARARHSLEKRAISARRVRWKPTEPVATDEIQTRMPSGWIPARINDTGLYINGLAFKPAEWKESGRPIIRIQNLTDPSKEFNFAQGDFPEEVVVRDGDLLVSWSATLEAFVWERGVGILNQHIFRVIPTDDLTTRDFLLLLLRSAIREMAKSDHAHGLVMTHINRGPFLRHVVAIPPLAEQHRIVAKVDELVALCDRLEEARTAGERTRKRLTKASYAQLAAADADNGAFRTRARFVIGALPALTAHAAQIKHLRQIILALAVHGKLVEQDPADEPAIKNLARARLSLKERARSTRRMRWKPTEPVAADEIEKEMPFGWIPGRINDTGLYINGLAFKPTDWKQSGLPIIRIQNLTDPSKDFNFARGDFPEEVLVRDGDLLVSWSATLEAFVWERGEGILNQHIFRVIPDDDLTTRDFLLLVLRSAIRAMAEGDHAHGLVMTHINRGPFLQHVVAIPPLAEQHRIVARVNEFMALCDGLEARLDAANATRQQLLDSLFHHALAPSGPEFDAV